MLGVVLPKFPKITYKKAMDQYGTDKPDLRIPLKLVDIGDLTKGVGFKPLLKYSNMPGCRVVAMRVPKLSSISRSSFEKINLFAKDKGLESISYIKVPKQINNFSEFKSPIRKFLSEEVLKKLSNRLLVEPDDLIMLSYGLTEIVNNVMSILRNKIGVDSNLFTTEWAPLWVVDFPMFEFFDGRWHAMHHPFTAPKENQIDSLDNDPGNCLSRGYDMVLNGSEIGGGSIRINKAEIQKKVFNLFGIGDEEVKEKFGFLLEALQYGCPPHGGMAFGFDRIAMLMTKSNSLRDIIAFPKTQTATCPLTMAPSSVSKEQLDELGILNSKSQ